MIDLLATKFEYKSSIDGITYEFSPLTLGMLADYCLWYQYKELHDFKYNVAHLVDADVRKEMQKELIKKCSARSYELNDPDLAKSMMTAEGVIQQLYLSVRKKHPEITYDKIQAIIPMDDLNHIITNVYKISGLGTDGLEEDEDKDDILGES